MKPGKELTGETIRIRVDPNLTWFDHVATPPKAHATAAPPATPAPVAAASAPAVPTNPSSGGRVASPVARPVDITLTRRTYIFAHARTMDGVDLQGAATESSPDDRRGRSDELATHNPASVTQARDRETNFTNIKEGSFVRVRYRQAGNVWEATNVSLIEPPLNPDLERAQPLNRVPAAPGQRLPGVPQDASVPPVSPGALPR
jgi:hypothetical protein